MLTDVFWRMLTYADRRGSVLEPGVHLLLVPHRRLTVVVTSLCIDKNVFLSSGPECCGVIYCHSKVFMVQATRLCNLICNLDESTSVLVQVVHGPICKMEPYTNPSICV
jgi:hypothetical protein